MFSGAVVGAGPRSGSEPGHAAQKPRRGERARVALVGIAARTERKGERE